MIQPTHFKPNQAVENLFLRFGKSVFLKNILKICFKSPSFAKASGDSVKKLVFWDFSV